MSTKKVVFLFISFNTLLMSLFGCENSPSTQISYSDSDVKDYFDTQKKLAEKNIPALMDKYNEVIHQLDNFEYFELDTTNKLIVDVPAFGGYSDSCRYNRDHLVTYFTLYDLDSTAKNPLDGMHTSLGYELRSLLRTARDIDKYQFAALSGSNKAKVTKISRELHNLKVLWESNYLLVLQVDEYVKTAYQPYRKSKNGSSLKANWHVFDFKNVRYLGSIPFEMNTDGFQANNTKATNTEKRITKRKLLPTTNSSGSSQYINEEKTVKETTVQSLSYKDKVIQAEYNFKETFTEAAKNAVNKYLLNSNEKFRNVVLLQ